MERKNKTQEREKKKKRDRKGKENAHRRGEKKNGCLIFLLSVGDKREILKLIFNTI